MVVVSSHLDSWDAGQGAQDDGVGCLIALEAAALLRDLGLTPRRTIRVVFYTNEENGLAGGTQYRENADMANHVAALESDSGNGPANGFTLDVRPLYPPDPTKADSTLAESVADEKRAAREQVRHVQAYFTAALKSFAKLGDSRPKEYEVILRQAAQTTDEDRQALLEPLMPLSASGTPSEGHAPLCDQ